MSFQNLGLNYITTLFIISQEQIGAFMKNCSFLFNIFMQTCTWPHKEALKYLDNLWHFQEAWETGRRVTVLKWQITLFHLDNKLF